MFHQIINHANGGTLFTEEESATIVEQVLRGLRYLHQNKLIMMDLKPQNILFQATSTVLVKLIDFDLVRTTVGREPVPLIGCPLPS